MTINLNINIYNSKIKNPLQIEGGF